MHSSATVLSEPYGNADSPLVIVMAEASRLLENGFKFLTLIGSD